MADFGVLKELFCDNIMGATSLSPVHGRRFTRLKETGKDAKLKTVDLLDISADALVLKMDTYKQPSTLFRGGKGENKRCDYVVITNLNDKDIILFIELKSKLNDGEVQQQFMGAECAIDYCNAVLKRFHKQDCYFDSFEKRFVVFYKGGSIHKRTTGHKPPNNTVSYRYLKYPNPHEPSIRELVGA